MVVDQPATSGGDEDMKPGDEVPPSTPGTGEALCRTCGGRGRVADDLCPDCNGTGKVRQGVGGA